MKRKKSLTKQDEWFFNNLYALMDAERELVLIGKKKLMDRDKLAEFIYEHGGEVQQPEPMPRPRKSPEKAFI